MITGKNQIGNTLSATGTITFTTYNPELDRENDVVFTEATKEEIEQSLSLATDAFKEFRNISGKKKAEFLNAIAALSIFSSSPSANITFFGFFLI